MRHADIQDLARLALDPADAPQDVRRHVESCPSCTALLAGLADVRRLAAEDADALPLVPPPPGLRDRVLAAALDDRGRAEGPGAVHAPRRRRIPVWAAGLAAAVTLVAGLGLGRLTAGPSEQPDDSGTLVAATDLTALDSDDPRGDAEAMRSEDTVTLRVRASDLGGDDGAHEVWLINTDGERMVSLGFLASGDAGEFEVPSDLIDQGYRTVDISAEPDDGDPTHSGVSLARGELA